MSQSPVRPMSSGAAGGKDKSKSQYIRPTQGLALRKAGGTMQVNLENIGGRILVLAERNTHKTRMQTIKPVVNVKPPWGHEKMKKRAAGRENAARRMQEAQHRVGQLLGGSGSTGYSAVPKAMQQEFDVKSLDPADAQVVNDFVELLGRLPVGDAKQLTEQSLRRSEENRLLGAYTGVFPELTDSEEERDPPPHSPATASTAPSADD
eukprot:TRINITY_DN1583_c0_g2_i1.p1 TRINITY_DN1583_c0_g2~~TRINITY_DN1583_c0_g2_i1.p1  ORF type:complete len:207 (+),score=66.29 TRINITY_DN1583_c0_g2_i1:74-694(+)